MWQKVAKLSKSKRNEIELRSFHHSTRLDELIILVWSNVQIGWKMAKLWPPKHWPKAAARLIWAIYWPFWPHFSRYRLIIRSAHHNYQEWWANQFLGQSDLKWPFYPIKTSILATNWPLSQNVHSAKLAPWKTYLLLGFLRYSHADFCMWCTRLGGIYCSDSFLRYASKVAQGGKKWLECH